MDEKSNRITITGENGEEVVLFVLEQTTLNGKNYLIATEDEDDEESVAYILKETVNNPDSDEISYAFVEDENEIEAVAGVFEELLEDCEIMPEE